MPTQKLHAWLDPATAVPGPSGQPRVIHDEGVPLPVREIIDMRGAGVTATDDEAGDRTIITIPGAAAGTVVSVFGRPGPVITAQAGDYTAAQVTNAVSTLGSYADPAWITSIDWSKVANEPASFPPSAHTHDWTTEITGKPASFPPSVHVHAAADVTSGVFAAGRLGTGTPSASNYLRGDGAWTALTAAQVTNAVSDLGSYSNPSWITGLAWGKLSGVPSNVSNAVANTTQVIAGTGLTGGGALSANVTLNANIAGIQTPWVANIDGAGFALNYPNRIHIRANPLNTAGAESYTGLILDRTYGDTGDTIDIVYPGAARIALLATGTGEKAFVLCAQTASGNGETNEVMRIAGTRKVGIGTNNPQNDLHVSRNDNCYITCETTASTVSAVHRWLAPGTDWQVTTAGSGVGAPYGRALYINDVTGGGVRMLFAQGGTIMMWLGGSLKTLSVDGSGFVKAA